MLNDADDQHEQDAAGAAAAAAGIALKDDTPLPRVEQQDDVQHLHAEDVHALLQTDAALTLVDVRTPAERAICRLDGSILLDDESCDALLLRERDELLVFYCHHGIRSYAAARYFLRNGFRRVVNLTGGIEAWSLRVDAGVPRY
ncbi:MAG: rhodanese-like domain-containing protein [Polyangiaceae bacterium]